MNEEVIVNEQAPQVTLYSQPGCAPCFAARTFLAARKIRFAYKDVQADPQAFRELVGLGSQSTPTLVIDGEVLVGFDPEKVAAALARRGTA